MSPKALDNAVVFGKYQNLVGTVTAPIEKNCDTAPVAAIFMTAGMLHHAGPFRLHLDLAHQLSKSNIVSMRFDLSGIGESFGVGTTGRSIDRAANETAQAMDYLTSQYGIEKFVLFGLCSGADDSVHTALSDHRVVGFVSMDGCGYPTKKFYWNRLTSHYLSRLLMLSKWMGVVKRLFGGSRQTPSSLQSGSDIREFPTQDVAEKEFQSLVQRGVDMHFVFTGGIAEYYNYVDQFHDMFSKVDWNGKATTTFFPHMDHIAFLCEDRNQLVADVTSKMIEMTNQHAESRVDVTDPPPAIASALPQLNLPLGSMQQS